LSRAPPTLGGIVPHELNHVPGLDSFESRCSVSKAMDQKTANHWQVLFHTIWIQSALVQQEALVLLDN
jgi:hypothetical protein